MMKNKDKLNAKDIEEAIKFLTKIIDTKKVLSVEDIIDKDDINVVEKFDFFNKK